MMADRAAGVAAEIRRLVAGGTVVAQPERDLRDRFVADGDEAAFEAIVRGRGPMVAGVCRAILADPADVDDAFQATFLVLARRAGSLRDGDGLGPWLHGVARRVALRARAVRVRRLGRERSDPVAVAAAPGRPTPGAEEREQVALIHAEVDRLPRAERSALILCDLEGLSHGAAAAELGWPLGTVKARVARARDRLRARLARRGVTLASAGLAATLASAATRAATLPPGLVAATTRAAVALLAGRLASAGLISLSVLSLTQGAARTMILSKLQAGVVALAVASSVVAVPSLIADQQPAGPPPAGAEPVGPVVAPPLRDAVPVEAGLTPGLAESIPLQVATAAVKVIATRDLEHKMVYDDVRFAWYQRLATAEFDAAKTKGERIQAATGFVKRHQEYATRQVQRLTLRITKVDWLEQPQGSGQFWDQANETVQPLKVAESWLAAVQAAPDGIVPPPEFKPAPPPADPKAHLAQLPPTPGTHVASFPTDQVRHDAIRAKLDERISINFPNDTPFSDVIRYIEQSTQDEAAGLPTGIPIYIHPQGLQTADTTLASTVAINLEGVPLRTTLTLLLDQLHLAYVVEGGVLIIQAKPAQAPPPTAEVNPAPGLVNPTPARPKSSSEGAAAGR